MILTATALKHGTDDSSTGTAEKSPQAAFTRITRKHYTDMGSLAELSWHYARFIQLSKAVSSGAILAVRDGWVSYSTDDQLARLPRLENRRLEQNASNLLSPVAAIAPWSDDAEQQVAHAFSSVLVAMPVYEPTGSKENRPWEMRMPEFHGGLPILVNYAPMLYDLTDFAELARLYAMHAIGRQVLSSDDLVLCLRGLTQNRLARIMQFSDSAEFFFRTGLGYHDLDRLAAWLEDWITKASEVGKGIKKPRKLA